MPQYSYYFLVTMYKPLPRSVSEDKPTWENLTVSETTS